MIEESKQQEKKLEYIFLIDRSGSMYQAITLARQALMLFLQSIEYGSLFNVCSYGSNHDFIFKDGSVQYDEVSLQKALDLIAEFDADYGGTEIFNPLDEIFRNIKSRQKHNVYTHIYLLTDGAVHNTQAIVELVKLNCGPSSTIKLHTFGVGSGADERLIKGCAFAGVGNFNFIYKDEEIENKVIESLSKTKLEYLLVTEAKVLDEDDKVIDELPDLPAPLVPGSLFCYENLLLGKPRAASFSVTIYDPNTNKETSYQRLIKNSSLRSILSSVVGKNL